ncbi:putative alpha-1,2-mannosidase [Dysgonomonas alginatilytica]|uniref:Putative alpha-1,2-mannosidase n=2 Tax=Dysgonomonas alginatilytica TaxID=1605892 RepID=A0A2V3PN11_9BACT|nr:putative alpha-1,2-mannosidase [Dysgonomonas alginatilytica]
MTLPMIKTYMKYLLILATLLMVPLGALYSQDHTKSKLTSYVNPFIGTGAVAASLSGNNYPGATVPFGMIQLSPDTRNAPDWAQASGYDYNDKSIFGFSHTHLSGTGVAEFFDVLLMPVTGDIAINKDVTSDSMEGWQSAFSHDNEKAHPGYYQVNLSRYNINAELTATTHAGFHRYTFPKNQQPRVVLDLNHSLNKNSWSTRIINSQIKIIDQYTIEGYRLITGWAKLRKVYFYAKFSKPIVGNKMVDGNTTYSNNWVVNGSDLRAILDFENKNNSPLLIKVGLSSVSSQNAKLNLDTEIRDWNFNKVVADADNVWEKELSKIKIEGTDLQKEIFYTSLYHVSVQPNTMSDVNGEYTDIDYTKRSLSEKEGKQYSTFSLWDTYRAAHPLYTLLQPERTSDFINSMLRQYDAYGYLPIWQLWGQENYCMIGNHSIPVIVDAALKGLKGFDVERAYEAIKTSSMTPHLNSPFDVWEKYGYMPENLQSQSVSITLEIAYDDWCVAQLAKKLGKEEDYNHFTKRSLFYKNLYNSQSGFFQSKNDKGNWIEPFDPFKYGSNGGYPFTEGNAWQYFWYVPHDVNTLVKMVGGDKAFTKKLDDFFTLEHQSGELNDNASGFIGQYAHGNEPSHHVAYLYNYAGQPWKTQYYVSKILTELYNNTSAGYAGNDDCGEMSAWYVLSSIGFYPVNPANGIFVIGTPHLESASIELLSGKTFKILAQKQSPKDIYIQSASLNGKKYDQTYITYNDIVNGGTLEFKMGSKPSKWGSKPQNIPPDGI